MVYIVYDSRKVIACRCGDNDFLSACIDMCLCFCLGCIESGTLQNYVYTNLAPRKFSSVCLCVDSNLLAIYYNIIFASFYRMSIVSALSRIIL